MIADIINFDDFPLSDDGFRNACKSTLDDSGALVMPGFLTKAAINSIKQDGEAQKHLAYYTADAHNIYISDPDPDYPADHPRNREVASTKGCITDDQIPESSALHKLYDAQEFRSFLCAVLGENALHDYADPLSSINLHYADEGQELGWHFDNSSFAVTLLIQKPEGGGVFEYVKDVRNADAGEWNFEDAEKVLNGEMATETLSMDDGTLVLFRGQNSMHRVTPTIGDTTRMLAVLAYNAKPGIALSKSARMTFYGRTE